MYREYPKFLADEIGDYGRKSRTDDPLLSVEEVLRKHDKILEEFAIKNFGGPIPEKNKYREIGSSESIDERPELLRLLKDIESPKLKAIMVVDVQRLSRGDLEDAGRLIKLLRYTNTYVITPLKIYDLRDEYDRDAFERELKRGNEYLEYIKKILNRGRLASVKEGNYIGSVAPYGFDKVVRKEDKYECHTLVENKEEANVVRMIFDWYCNEGLGTSMICRRLESMNIKTKTGNPNWIPPVILNMLENVHYIGYVRWNWRKTLKIIENQEVKKTRPKGVVDEYLVFKGKHDGIVSKELFDRAQEIMGTRHRTRTDCTLRNPFSGLMYCACGHKIGHNTFTKNGKEISKPMLVCNNQIHCKNGSADFEDVMNRVCETLADCILDFESRVDNNRETSIKLHKELVSSLEHKLKVLEKKEELQWEGQYDPDPDKRLPQDVFKRLNEKLLKEKEEIKKALCEAYESMPQPVDYREKIVKFTDVLGMLKDPNISAEIKNQYLKDIIERIDYERPQTVRITKANSAHYGIPTGRGAQYYRPPYKLSITLK